MQEHLGDLAEIQAFGQNVALLCGRGSGFRHLIENGRELLDGPESAFTVMVFAMTAKLTTHVLDTANGRPAGGVRVQVFRDGKLLVDSLTNEDGRCDNPLLEGEEMFTGACRLLFHVGDYFRASGVAADFLEDVPVDFQLREDQSYHVPLVCTPWSYTTYRGS